MTRFLSVCGLTTGAALLATMSPAFATCVLPLATYTSGSTFGADAATNTGCLSDSQQGGAGSTSVSTSYSDPGGGSLAASADLASGTLTADADDVDGGYASASEWDTFTFSGLPAGGSMITATLSLNGSVSGIGSGSADVQEAGPGGTIQGPGALDSSTFFNAATGIPLAPSISLSFSATNDTPYTVYAYIDADSGGSLVDLSDPPTLDLFVPLDVTVTSASDVFSNFLPSPVPEPSSLALLAAALVYPVRRRRSRIAR